MSITLREGFQIFSEGSSVESLALESGRIKEYMDYFRKNKLRKLYISSFHGYKDDNISFLSEYPFVQEIYVYSNDIDYTGIHSLSNLKFLILSVDKKGTIDFSCFPDLEIAFFSWKHSVNGLESCQHLKELHLRDYRSRTNTLSELPQLNALVYLELIQARIESLIGLSHFNKLEKLELHYLRKLTTLQGIETTAGTLIDLSINNSRKIQDHSLVSGLKRLKQLAFNDCGEIPSVGFVRLFPELETFRFVNTNIKNGDLSPCLGVNKVRFNYKKHYSHRPEELERH